MKSYSSLFPSYCFREDDAAVFFELPEICDSSSTINRNNFLAESNSITFTPITGNVELVDILKRAKLVCDSFGRKNFEELRGKTNYYEGLGKGCFLNRSAMKLVNLDYIFSLIEPIAESDHSESSSSTAEYKKYQEILPENEGRLHFSFLDLCGGPGGFIECIILKCRHQGIAVTGFGMTLLIGDLEPGLRGIMKSCNWNISHLQDPPYSVISSDQKCTPKPDYSTDSSAANILVITETDKIDNTLKEGKRESIYGESMIRYSSECRVILVDGVTGTGDICVRENLDSLDDLFEMELPEGCGVEEEISGEGKEMKSFEDNDEGKSDDIADNTEKNERTRNKKKKRRKFVQFVCSDGFDHETEAFRIVLGQVIGMIKCLRVGGNFVMKVFSCTKAHTLKLFVLLSQLFEKITLTKPVTSRPVSGERFLVALNLLPITFKSRDIIQEKLWLVCDEIKEWELKNKMMNDNNIETSMDRTDFSTKKNSTTPDKNGNQNQCGREKNDLNEENEKNNKDEDRVLFSIFWPFYISQSICDLATKYLTKINNSHIMTQLISYYKIIELGIERGLSVTDEKLLQDLGNIPIPSPSLYSFDSLSTECMTLERTEGYSDSDNDSYDDDKNSAEHSLPKKKNKRRAINNKRRRQNKKKRDDIDIDILRNDDSPTPHQSMNEGREIQNENVLKRVIFREDANVTISAFDVNNSHIDKDVVDSISDSYQHNNDNNINNIIDNNINNNVINEVNDHLKNIDIIHRKCIRYKKEIEDFNVLRVSDLARKESSSKSIRVHEYYKNWRIYDLDVIY